MFRSRLEARWQCMFDLLSWQVEYEPAEINGYNPDFIIKSTSSSYECNHIIVEIKPSVFIDEKYINEVFGKYENQKSHILLLSDFPFCESISNHHLLTIGLGSQYWGKDESQSQHDEELFGKWAPIPNRSEMDEMCMKCQDDFSSMTYIFDGMVLGSVERKHFLQTDYHGDQEVIGLLKSMWKYSGNQVMFNVK